MALRTGGNSNLKFIRLRDGKFYIGKDKDQPFGELEGTITGLRYKDEEYEGAPLRKLIVNLIDGDEQYQLGLNCESRNYTSFISFLKNVDIAQPIVLVPKVEEGEKDGKAFKNNSLLISQKGTYAKGYFTKADMHGAPDWKKVKVGKKVVLDKQAYLEFMENFVTENFINKINKNVIVNKAQAAVAEPVEEVAAEADAMPWDE